MPIRELVSPVTRRGSKVGSNQPLSPGARSDPGREGGPKFDSVPAQPSHACTSLHMIVEASCGVRDPEMPLQ
jgi:hypothetical protein